ncbi:MAG: hypothetical protein JSR43_16270 [Proteobacteria bacterium]|jgi:hypothetical protein|nr:hypothetical protein [Pseudomonadota bacterium]HOL38239.1 hypothetical protein [Rubrivivax sp.]
MSRHFVAVLFFVAAAAPAADVYRCGLDGRSYGDRPCAEGRRLDMADARSVEQVAQARAVADRDRRLDMSLAAERRVNEQMQARLPAGFRVAAPMAASQRVGTKPHHDSQPHAQRRHAKPRAPRPADGVFRAAAPRSQRANG